MAGSRQARHNPGNPGEDHCIRWNIHVVIREAVEANGGYAACASQPQIADIGIAAGPGSGSRLSEDKKHEYRKQEIAEDAEVRQKFQIIVVGMFKGAVYHGVLVFEKSSAVISQAHAEHGICCDQMQTIGPDREASF